MAENDDDEGFGDFKFVPSSAVNSISGSDPSRSNNDDDDWGHFINSGAFSRTESLPAQRVDQLSDLSLQPGSALSRVGTAWASPTGALPLSIFGLEEEEAEGGSGAAGAGFNGGTEFSWSFEKVDRVVMKGGLDLNYLIADLYKQSLKSTEDSGLDPKKEAHQHGKAVNFSSNESVAGSNGVKIDSGSNGLHFDLYVSGWGSNGLVADQNSVNQQKNGLSGKLEEDDDDGWEFKGSESIIVVGVQPKKEPKDEDVNEWEFKTAGTKTLSADGNMKIEDGHQENLNGAGFTFSSSLNNSVDLFGLSDGFSNKPGQWEPFILGSATDLMQNGTKNSLFSHEVDQVVDPDKASRAFKDTFSETVVKAKEESEVADTSTELNGFSFDGTIQSKGDSQKLNGALPLSIFGDEELELEHPVIATDKAVSLAVATKDPHSSISIDDLISSLYSQSEQKVNHIHNGSEDRVGSTQMVMDSNLGHDDLDDDTWEFKGAISATGTENQKFVLNSRGPHERYSKNELNNHMDFYSKLVDELCFVAVYHLENMKKVQGSAVHYENNNEVKALDKEIQDIFSELYGGGMSKKYTLDSCIPRSTCLDKFVEALQEERFRVLESEYILSERLLLAEKNTRSAVELLKHVASTLKILRLQSIDQQSSYVSTWCKILSVCAGELRHGAFIWKLSLQKNIHSQILAKPQGREYILALGEIYRVVKIIEASAVAYKPWVLSSADSSLIFQLLVECSALWSDSGMEETLETMSDPTNLYDTVKHGCDLNVHELYKEVISGQMPICHLSALTAGALPGMKMVIWDGSHYLLTLANLWANLISQAPPDLPDIRASENAL